MKLVSFFLNMRLEVVTPPIPAQTSRCFVLGITECDLLLLHSQLLCLTSYFGGLSRVLRWTINHTMLLLSLFILCYPLPKENFLVHDLDKVDIVTPVSYVKFMYSGYDLEHLCCLCAIYILSKYLICMSV